MIKIILRNFLKTILIGFFIFVLFFFLQSMLAPLYLLYVSVNVINNEQCIVSHLPQYAERIYNTTICTMAREKVGACTGDSGGPLVQHKKLVGVISWGVPCALGVPDQHSRISSYLDWIKQHTGVVPS